MIWNPWRRVRELELLMAQAHVALAVEREQRAYWKSKAEVLLDNALLRKGEISSPVFTPPPAASVEQTLGSVFGPLAVTEIESGRRRQSRGDAARNK